LQFYTSIHSPGDIGLKLELIGVKLESISYEAEFIPY